MAKARLETNFIRLLDMCKNMGNNGKHTEWRFEKYVATLDEYLLEMSKGPMAPDKEEMDEYLRSVKFLRGLIVTEKSPSAAKFVGSLAPCSSPYGDTVSKEIHHKVAAQYSNQVREELLQNKGTPSKTDEEKETGNEFENPTSILRQRKTAREDLLSSVKTNVTPKDSDTVVKDEQAVQEGITQNLLLLTRNMKEQSQTINMYIKKDMEMLSKSNTLADDNRLNLDTQTLRLRERSGFCHRCWVWVLVASICAFFMGMVIFMRIFKKPRPA